MHCGETVLQPRVYKSSEEMAPIGIQQDIWVTVARGEVANLKTTANVQEPLIAPLTRHTDMVKLPPSRPNSLLDRVQPIKNFHPSSLPPIPRKEARP